MTIRKLMEEQRMRVRSSNLAERFAAALLIPGVLAERLRELNDVHLGRVLDHVSLGVPAGEVLPDLFDSL